MTKLRIVNGIPEVEGSTEEIVELLRKLGSNPKTPVSNALQEEPKKTRSHISDDSVLDTKPMAELIEAQGRPIMISMAGLQVKQYGRRISSKDERQLYEKYHSTFEKARTFLEKKYHGTWETRGNETVEGAPSKIWVLIEGQETQSITQTSLPSDVGEKESIEKSGEVNQD